MGLFTLWQTPIAFYYRVCSNVHMMRTNRIKKAAIFAAKHFELNGIVRKYHNTPYIQHPMAVASIVDSVGGDENQIIAAILHDSVEDCKTVSIGMIQADFGDDVASLVSDLIDVSKPEDGNRVIRKEIDRIHTASASARAQTIKLADLIHNTADITKHDKDFAIVYLKEKELLLQVLTKGNETLYLRACQQLKECKGQLGI